MQDNSECDFEEKLEVKWSSCKRTQLQKSDYQQLSSHQIHCSRVHITMNVQWNWITYQQQTYQVYTTETAANSEQQMLSCQLLNTALHSSWTSHTADRRPQRLASVDPLMPCQQASQSTWQPLHCSVPSYSHDTVQHPPTLCQSSCPGPCPQ